MAHVPAFKVGVADSTTGRGPKNLSNATVWERESYNAGYNSKK